MSSPTPRRRPDLAWCGYAAFVLGLLHAAASLYWGLGGTAALHTIGGELERLARERDPALLTVVWITAALKLFAALLGLAVVRHWGRRLPRRALLVPAWAAGSVLTVYGGALVLGQAMVKAGLIDASPDMDWTAFHWHLYLWDPWFLLWGLLLSAATYRFSRDSHDSHGADGGHAETGHSGRREKPGS
ncbi:DUF3995 domain-containing protein [Streptomyces otsuchiensis]|uniref:DUF3995 domain-containing protein n=1 Tax=Streptomyces otsuchiensis TaxID=2681388 RepID=UPI0010302CA6|nr:DUF3995 domain-containing protein [Streptomyces otsuchiensis]